MKTVLTFFFWIGLSLPNVHAGSFDDEGAPEEERVLAHAPISLWRVIEAEPLSQSEEQQGVLTQLTYRSVETALSFIGYASCIMGTVYGECDDGVLDSRYLQCGGLFMLGISDGLFAYSSHLVGSIVQSGFYSPSLPAQIYNAIFIMVAMSSMLDAEDIPAIPLAMFGLAINIYAVGRIVSQLPLFLNQTRHDRA